MRTTQAVGAAVVLLLGGWCGAGGATAADAPRIAAWAWLAARDGRSPAIVYLEPRVFAPDRILAGWRHSPGEPIGFAGHPPGSPGARRAVMHGMYGSDRWLPTAADGEGMLCRITRDRPPLEREAPGPKGPLIFLPALHPSLDLPHVTRGAGDRPAAGDMPLWSFWQASRLFALDAGNWVVIASDTQAYLATVPPKTVRLKPPLAGSLIPVRLGGNPFLLLDDTRQRFPAVLSACRLGDRVVVTSESGRMAAVAGLAGRPHWIRELSQPFGPAKVRCFNHGETIHALVKRSRQPGWRRHVSRDARRWGKGDLLPVPADETPVDSRQGLLCTISITGKQRRCSVWKRASTGIWAIAAKHLLAPDHVLVDVAGGPGPRIYALVGERKGKLLSISLRQIYAD